MFKTNQEKVEEFMLVMDQHIPEYAYREIPYDLAAFRNCLIQDEVSELFETPRKDVQNIARELADILYVVYGTALAYGIDLDSVFGIVHKANMEKASGPVREDGKRLKPEGWRFPEEEFAEEIYQQQGRILSEAAKSKTE